MLLLTAISIFFILMIYGVGLASSRIFHLRLDFFTEGDTFWLGFCALIGILQIWHFFAPVNGWLLALISLIAAVGLFLHIKKTPLVWKKQYLWSGGALLLPLLVLLNHSLYSPASYDFGLYHLQTVKWFNQFALVPGLGNLQHRLAFNSSQYLYAAFLNSSFFKGYSYYIADVILLSVLSFQSLIALRSWIKDKSISPSVIFRVLMIPAILWQAGTQPLAGYPADMTIFILQIVVFEKLVQMWGEEVETNRRQGIFLLIVCLSTVGITIKLSFAIFGLLSILAAMLAVIKREHLRGFLHKPWISLVVIVPIWLLPWLLRNIILSGYFLFPSQIFSLNVPWKMPSYLVDGLQQGISLWAKTYSGQLPYTADLAWLVEWIKRFVFEARSALAAGGLLLIILFILRLQKKQQQAEIQGYWLLFILLSASLLMWFFSAPTYRFSGALIWLWLIVLVLMLVDWFKVNFSCQAAWNSSLILMILFLVWLPNQISRNLSLSTLWIVPTEQVVAQEQTESMNSIVKTAADGLVVHLPASGESCWDLPLPCTTPMDFLPNLRLISPQDISKGFYIQK